MLSSKWLAFLVSKIKTSTQKFRIVNWKESWGSEIRLLRKKFSDVKDIANASYGVLRTLRKLKHFTDFHLVQETCRVACNIKAWLYCDSVYSSLPGYVLNHLQNIEFAAVSFVFWEICRILHILRKPNSIIVLLLFQNIPKLRKKARTC